MENLRPESRSLAEKIIKELIPIKEMGLRTRALAEKLNQLDAETIAEALCYICQKSSRGDSKFKELLFSCSDTVALAEIMGEIKLTSVRLLAGERGFHAVVRLLSKPSPLKGLQEPLPGRNGYWLEDYFTVGERVSLAKGQDRQALERLMSDPLPLVIRQLLKNARLTEHEVVRIAARRPANPRVLEEIYKSPRWIGRYEVKVALVRNPYSPPRIGVALVNFLLQNDLLEVKNDAQLHPTLREAAHELLEAKKGRRAEEKE